MSNRKWPRKGRSADARPHASSAQEMFEHALRDDPKKSDRKFDARSDRKTLQLCRQVQHALMFALAGECADDLFRDIYIESVIPAGNGGHLLVRIIVPQQISVPQLLGRLEDRAGKLRSAVASSISRKRVPTLCFIPVPLAGELTND